MSDLEAKVALLESQLAAKEKENSGLRTTTRNFSGQIAAYQQLTQELVSSNVHLRGNCILLEDDLNTMRREKSSLSERVSVLEKEKEEAKCGSSKPDSKLAAVNK